MPITNTAHSVPTSTEDQIQWLVDRASISDLISAFARCTDARDWTSLSTLVSDDATFLFGEHTVAEGREAFVATAEQSMSAFAGTWHMTGNPGIQISGDTAQSRHYGAGVHLFDLSDKSQISGAGTYYDCELVRHENGWLISRMALNHVWSAGDSRLPL